MSLLQPSFIIAGMARAGTTALAQSLAAHPWVGITDPKEPHFFAFAGSVPHYNGPWDEIEFNRHVIHDAGTYNRLLRRVDRPIVGDASASTLLFGPRALANIQQHAPEAKLIVLLREPSDRLLSNYWYMVSRHQEDLPLEAALAAEESRISDGWRPMYWYGRQSRIASQLSEFLERFGGKRVLCLFYEDWLVRPDQVWTRTLSFLGAPAWPMPTVDHVNTSGVPRRYLGVLTNPTVRNALRFDRWRSRIPARTRNRLRSATLNPSRAVEPAIRERLYLDFSSERARLRSLIREHQVPGPHPKWLT